MERTAWAFEPQPNTTSTKVPAKGRTFHDLIHFELKTYKSKVNLIQILNLIHKVIKLESKNYLNRLSFLF